MHKQWVSEEEDAKRLAALVNNGTDRDLAQHLAGMPSGTVKSQATHVAKDGGSTPLHMAATKERLEGLEAMFRHNVDVNARNGRGESPLHTCLTHNAMSSAHLLVNHGADVNEIVCRQRKETILHRMVKGDRLKAVELLLDFGAATNATTREGDTPLHFAARYNRPIMARRLVQVGCDVNATNKLQETPLHVAVANRSFEVAKHLIKSKASVTIPDKQGMSALHAAVVGGYVDLARMMLNSNSTNVNSKELLLGRTPLLLACAGDSHKMAPLLLVHGADANLTSNYRKSVLHVAASKGNTHALNAVIKHATNLNALSTNNKTPLHCAVKEGHKDAARVLLNAGVNANLKDIEGNTALHMASSAGDTDMLSLLLQHGVFLNATNMQQQTALHLAYMEGHEESGWILVQAGCDEDLIDVHEKQARHYLDEYHKRLKTDSEAGTDTGRTSSSKVTFSNVLDEFYASNADNNPKLRSNDNAINGAAGSGDVLDGTTPESPLTNGDITKDETADNGNDEQLLTTLYLLSFNGNGENEGDNSYDHLHDDHLHDDDQTEITDDYDGEHDEDKHTSEHHLDEEGDSRSKSRKTRRHSKTKHRRNSVTSPHRSTKTANRHATRPASGAFHQHDSGIHQGRLEGKLKTEHFAYDLRKHDSSHHSKQRPSTATRHAYSEGQTRQESKSHAKQGLHKKLAPSDTVSSADKIGKTKTTSGGHTKKCNSQSEMQVHKTTSTKDTVRQEQICDGLGEGQTREKNMVSSEECDRKRKVGVVKSFNE